MIRIEHVALWTDDLERLAAFYARYFGASVGSKYVNALKRFESRFLEFDGGARFEIMTSGSQQLRKHEPGAQRMGFTHVAIAVGSRGGVDELTTRMRQDGYTIVDGPRQTGDGYYESVVLDPDGNRVEITV